jgi:hypothetical protein
MDSRVVTQPPLPLFPHHSLLLLLMLLNMVEKLRSFELLCDNHNLFFLALQFTHGGKREAFPLKSKGLRRSVKSLSSS